MSNNTPIAETKSSSFLKRAISGLILVVVVVEMTVINAWTFYTLWGVIGFLLLWEYYRLLGGAFKRNVTAVVKNRVTYLLVGTLYILQAIALIFTMDPMLVITLLFVVWLSDTGAYIVGVTIGKHKMAPKLSPKKSWEGFFGGLLFGTATALLMYALYWSNQLDAQEYVFGNAALGSGLTMRLKWLGFGLLVSLAAVGGDLIESKFKRVLGVKDSGRIIPGHGGMLDRFDALLLATPVAWVYVWATGLI